MIHWQKESFIPYALVVSLLLAGCGNQVDCDIPNRHIHRYHNDVGVDVYIDGEYQDAWGYCRTDDYIEMTKQDEIVFNLLQSKYLFDAEDNYDYLYHLMSTKKDYLEFYYKYETTYTTEDEDGNTEVHTETHRGWHSNPNSSRNTGRVRLCHHRYYAYRIVYKNGKYVLEKSPNVDDIREILPQYPYAHKDCYTVVSTEFSFSKWDLPNLDSNDFDVFQGPNLDETSITYVKK